MIGNKSCFDYCAERGCDNPEAQAKGLAGERGATGGHRGPRPLSHSSSFLDNNFFVLLVPAAWSFEQLEAWGAGGQEVPDIGADFEFFSGRKVYASSVAGAYYAARLAVAEFLVKKKRQAVAIVFREIGPEYKASLGVWVIRESVRNALKQKPVSFGELRLALKFLETRLSVPLKNYKEKSALMDFLLYQKNLGNF